jgi:hypothetical protein
MHITGKATPTEATRVFLNMNAENINSERVKQDVLLLTGAKDHFGAFNMHLKLHRKQVDALANARSVTERIFTREDQAQNHCQVGNIGLAMESPFEREPPSGPLRPARLDLGHPCTATSRKLNCFTLLRDSTSFVWAMRR